MLTQLNVLIMGSGTPRHAQHTAARMQRPLEQHGKVHFTALDFQERLRPFEPLDFPTANAPHVEYVTGDATCKRDISQVCLILGTANAL